MILLVGVLGFGVLGFWGFGVLGFWGFVISARQFLKFISKSPNMAMLGLQKDRPRYTEFESGMVKKVKK